MCIDLGSIGPLLHGDRNEVVSVATEMVRALSRIGLKLGRMRTSSSHGGGIETCSVYHAISQGLKRFLILFSYHKTMRLRMS